MTRYVQNLPASKAEKDVIKLKYSASPFGKMQFSDVMSAVKVLTVKIFSITAWDIPPPDLKVILVDQLTKHLIESYPTLNVNEAEYAFRRYGGTVKDYGKQLNLVFFDQVMAQYMEERKAASRVEETAPLPEDKQLNAPAMTDAEKVEFGRWSALNMQQVETVYNCYEVLRRLNLMPKPTPEQADRYRSAAKARYSELVTTNFFQGIDIQMWVDNYRQKLACIEYFKNQPHEQQP